MKYRAGRRKPIACQCDLIFLPSRAARLEFDGMKPILGTASDELKTLLKKRANAREYGQDEELFAAGEKADYLPIIVKGKVKMVQYPEPGKEVIIGIFGDNEMFALPPVIDGKQYPASAYTMAPSEILLLHRSDFFDLLRESHEFTLAVLDWMSEMLRQKTASIQTRPAMQSWNRSWQLELKRRSHNKRRCKSSDLPRS